MQGGAAVAVSVRLVHLLLGAVGQEQHHQPQVVLHHGPEQLLAQGHVGLGQPHQEQLLLILSPDPALLLLPGGGKNRDRLGRESPRQIAELPFAAPGRNWARFNIIGRI